MDYTINGSFACVDFSRDLSDVHAIGSESHDIQVAPNLAVPLAPVGIVVFAHRERTIQASRRQFAPGISVAEVLR